MVLRIERTVSSQITQTKTALFHQRKFKKKKKKKKIKLRPAWCGAKVTEMSSYLSIAKPGAFKLCGQPCLNIPVFGRSLRNSMNHALLQKNGHVSKAESDRLAAVRHQR